MTALHEAIEYSALGWVKPELDETLRLVRVEVEGFADEPADTSRMRVSADLLHQLRHQLGKGLHPHRLLRLWGKIDRTARSRLRLGHRRSGRRCLGGAHRGRSRHRRCRGGRIGGGRLLAYRSTSR